MDDDVRRHRRRGASNEDCLELQGFVEQDG